MLRRATAVIAAVTIGVSAAATAAHAATVPMQDRAAAQCFGNGFDARADDATTATALMDGEVRLSPHAAARIPTDLTWREDPFKDVNWTFQLHTLRWADVLRREGVRTADQAMSTRHQDYLRDWLRDNPVNKPPSRSSWGDMQSGLRAVALACAMGTYGPLDWIVDGLRLHGTVLSDPTFAPPRGNHALHVHSGLLVAGDVLGLPTWTSAARSRTTTLLVRSVDAEGVIDEGSTGYQLANYSWYRESRRRIVAAGLEPGTLFDRVLLMPEFLAYATQPDGTYVQVGDSDRGNASLLRDSPTALYAATAGAEGTAPTDLYRNFTRGYVFGRSGWGTARPFADETFYSIRHGASLDAQAHAHQDAGALTLSAFGSPLLFDAGRYKYGSYPMTSYLKSRAAHNVVDVLGATYRRDRAATLVTAQHTSTHDLTTVRVTAMDGSVWTRTVLYSRAGGYFVVDDRVTNRTRRTMVQRWNLPDEHTVARTGSTLTAAGPGADLSLFWLGSRPALSVAKGQENPLLGWRGYRYGNAIPTPVAQARLTGTSGRFTTVIVPRRDAAVVRQATVRDVDIRGDQVVARVTANGVTEWVHLTPTAAQVRRR
jgi:hypothetical protein